MVSISVNLQTEYPISSVRDLFSEIKEFSFSFSAKTGEEPTPETKETIHDLLDNMEAIETAQGELLFYRL